MTLEQAISHLEEELENKQDWSCVACKEDHEQLLGWLKELKQIKGTKPAEALEDLKTPLHNEWLRFYPQLKDLNEKTKIVDGCRMVKSDADNYLAIKQYFTLKAQDKVKAFDLINEKDVDIKLLKWAYPSVEAYNVKVRTEKDYWWRKELTKEEFEFIGRLVGAK